MTCKGKGCMRKGPPTDLRILRHTDSQVPENFSIAERLGVEMNATYLGVPNNYDRKACQSHL